MQLERMYKDSSHREQVLLRSHGVVDMAKATTEEAIEDIKFGDYEDNTFTTRNHKNRNCIFCSKNIKGGETFIRNYPYPYTTQKNWVACEKCFKKQRRKI